MAKPILPKTKTSAKTAAIGAKLFPTLNGLPEAAREISVATLNQVLANLTDLYSQTKQAHWNVNGTQFYTRHKLFDELAEMFFEPQDDVAERIVQLGGIAKGTIRQAAAASQLPEYPSTLKDSLPHITALAERVAIAADTVRSAIDTTANVGDADTADLFTGISRTLDKALWFLEAHNRA